jgi:hypothetical protein
LAGIHLAVAVPLILEIEADDLRSLGGYRKDVRAAAAETGKSPSEGADDLLQQEEIVTFDPCEGIIDYPLKVEALQVGEPWAASLSGLRSICRALASGAPRGGQGRVSG